ncbi:MAG: hypothetical protein COA79_25905 [Planctomycetota bacterium]|nr:MAG: hypothetical protein COA79_25905 [Planctomycetota bacterium]
MKTEEKIICDLVHDFVKENWDKIDREKCELTKNKKDFLEEVKTDVQAAIWVVMEVADWAMDKKYFKNLKQEVADDVEFTVWKIKDKYLRLDVIGPSFEWKIAFTEPKEKTVIYFD